MKGYETVCVDNGNAALHEIEQSRIANRPFGLLICDIQMPGMTGEELINTLRANEIQVPFLIITGYGEKALVVRMMRKGCRDFIDKPFEPDEIEKRVDLIFAKDSGMMLERKRLETMAKLGIHTHQLVHDMNNILAGTLGYATMALEALDHDNPSRKHLTKVLKTTSRAVEICANILPESQRLPTGAFASTELNDLIKPRISPSRP